MLTLAELQLQSRIKRTLLYFDQLFLQGIMSCLKNAFLVMPLFFSRSMLLDLLAVERFIATLEAQYIIPSERLNQDSSDVDLLEGDKLLEEAFKNTYPYRERLLFG